MLVKPNENAKITGATPKLTMSDRESICFPKSFDVFVKRATLPSR